MKNLNFILAVITLSTIGLQTNVSAKNNLKPLQADSTQNKVVDLVCKMKIKLSGSKTAVNNNKTYYFCSESCKQKFITEPSKYLKK